VFLDQQHLEYSQLELYFNYQKQCSMIKYRITIQFQDHNSHQLHFNYQGSGNQLLTYWERLWVELPNPIAWGRMGWQLDDFTGGWG
jgi:hypothetical protein